MKNVRETMTRAAVAALSLGAAIGFGCSDPDEERPAARETCERVETSGRSYCVWRSQGLLVETGYRCPSDLMNLQRIDDTMLVCSATSEPLGEDVLKELREIVPLPGEPTPTRTCADVESEYVAAEASVSGSCTADADCSWIGWACTLGSGGYDADGAILAGTTDAQTVAELEALRTEFEALQCGGGAVCNAPLSPMNVRCDAGACTSGAVADPCVQIKSDYDAIRASLSTSCAADTDCSILPADHELDGSCWILSGSNDASIASDLKRLAADYVANSCIDGPVSSCAAPAGPPTCGPDGTCGFRGGSRTCAEVESEYVAAEASVSGSCTADADCSWIGWACTLGSGGYDADGAILAGTTDAQTVAELEALRTEFEALQCGGGAVCNAPLSPMNVRCDAGACTSD